MNREIKFRAWDSKRSTMDYDPYGDEFTCEGTPINKVISGWPFTEDGGVTLMQYTGLKDKYGKEIYEGDVIGMDSNDGMVPAWVVVWSETRAFWSTQQIGWRPARTTAKIGSQLPSKYFWANHQVIGNIYENPELLPVPFQGDTNK